MRRDPGRTRPFAARHAVVITDMTLMPRLSILCFALCAAITPAEAARPVADAGNGTSRSARTPVREPRCPPAETAPAPDKAIADKRGAGYGDAYRQATQLQREIARMQQLLDCGDRGVKDAYGARDAWDAVDAAAHDPQTSGDDAPP